MANWIIQTSAEGQLGATFQATLPCWNVDDSILWKPQWAPEQRGPRTYDRSNWSSLWPSSSFGGMNRAAPTMLLNQEYGSVDSLHSFEPDSTGLPGNQSIRFVSPINVPDQWQLDRFEMKHRLEERA